MEALSNRELQRQATEADLHGLQLSIHAIGDRANDAVLTMFESIVQANPAWDRRFRIEHAQHVRQSDFARFAALGVIVSAQPYHAIDDGVWAEGRIGAERCRTTYAFKSFLNAGVRVCFGVTGQWRRCSSCWASVQRYTPHAGRENPGGWIPQEKLTVEEAVRCTTINNAYADSRTRQEASPQASLPILSCFPGDVSPSSGKIADLRVEMTVVDGEVVYRR
jgi:predicted amidohydrolase YtcJ